MLTWVEGIAHDAGGVEYLRGALSAVVQLNGAERNSSAGVPMQGRHAVRNVKTVVEDGDGSGGGCGSGEKDGDGDDPQLHKLPQKL